MSETALISTIQNREHKQKMKRQKRKKNRNKRGESIAGEEEGRGKDAGRNRKG